MDYSVNNFDSKDQIFNLSTKHENHFLAGTQANQQASKTENLDENTQMYQTLLQS
jgi:hypothetical protein